MATTWERIDRLFHRSIGQLVDQVLDLAETCDDTAKAAALLVEHADRVVDLDRLSLLAGVRWRLAERLDRCPGDLVALAALGIASLAALASD